MTQPTTGPNTAGQLSPLQQLQAATTSITTTQGPANVNTPLIGAAAQPPKLTTLVYAPKVQVLVSHNGVQYDVSPDLVRCQLHREESSAATFYMTLVNPDWRYTPFTANGVIPLFSRMDPIMVYMTRINKIQVFTGYLDTVPYMQMYPGVVDFKATCTIKRLMHTWWNPALQPSLSLITGYQGTAQVQGSDIVDGGLGGLLESILTNVGGWSAANIHIQNFPTNLFTFLESVVTNLGNLNSANSANFQQMLLGDNQTPAPGAAAGANPNAGVPGPSVSSGTTGYIQQIIAACDSMGLGPSIQDNNQNAGLNQVGQTMEGSNDNAVKKAGQQASQTATTAQTANRASDAAIIGTAVAAVETGGGTSIRNLYNVAAPGSQQCTPNDGPGTNGTSCGIFQQQNPWGTAAQRMNPLQAATMFFTSLITNAPNWQNMDPGQAAEAVQIAAGSYVQLVDAAIPWATTQVQAIRAQQSGTSAASAIGGAGALGGAGGAAPSLNPSSVLGGAGIGGAGSAASGLAGMPTPNSEGAINWGMTQIGKPYVWGAAGPASYDCSGFVMECFKAIGVQLQHYTGTQYTEGTPGTPATLQRGDLCFPGGTASHVVIWLGNGTVLEATPPSVGINPVYFTPTAGNICRICQNGGVNPAAPYTSPTTNGPGNPPGALPQQGGGVDPGSSGGSAGGGVPQNLFSYLFTPQTFQTQTANEFKGEKAFIDGEPLINMVKSIAGAGLREFCSAPNGDFVAYYPDYWGIDGKPAVLGLEDIELKDVRIDMSDDPLTTHVYIEGDLSQVGSSPSIENWINTAGVATVEDTWLFQRLIAVAPGTFAQGATGDSIMRTFGIRPLNQTFSMAGSNELELLLACKVFMLKWAQQYQTSVTMTFMPELFPGMRVVLVSRNLSVYCAAVTHTCDFEAGFSTAAVIMAPANSNALSAMATVLTPGASPTGAVANAFANPTGQGVSNAKTGGNALPS